MKKAFSSIYKKKNHTGYFTLKGAGKRGKLNLEGVVRQWKSGSSGGGSGRGLESKTCPFADEAREARGPERRMVRQG